MSGVGRRVEMAGCRPRPSRPNVRSATHRPPRSSAATSSPPAPNESSTPLRHSARRPPPRRQPLYWPAACLCGIRCNGPETPCKARHVAEVDGGAEDDSRDRGSEASFGTGREIIAFAGSNPATPAATSPGIFHPASSMSSTSIRQSTCPDRVEADAQRGSGGSCPAGCNRPPRTFTGTPDGGGLSGGSWPLFHRFCEIRAGRSYRTASFSVQGRMPDCIATASVVSPTRLADGARRADGRFYCPPTSGNIKALELGRRRRRGTRTSGGEPDWPLCVVPRWGTLADRVVETLSPY